MHGERWLRGILSLRTGFLWQSGLPRPLQIVFKQAEVQAELLDWRGDDELESRIAAYLDEDLKQEFDFLAPPLGRLSLICVADDRYRLVCTLASHPAGRLE